MRPPTDKCSMNKPKNLLSLSSSLFTAMRMAWNTRARDLFRFCGGVALRIASLRSVAVNKFFADFIERAILFERRSSPN